MIDSSPKPSTKPALIPVWKQGLKGALVLLALAICGALVNASDRPEAVARGLVNIPLGFLLWWAVFTAVVWSWRKVRGKA